MVAFYLGADPRQPETYRVVKLVPPQPGTTDAPRGCWYVVEAKLVTSEYKAWFAEHCEMAAQFESRTGPIDRSVLVYRYKGAPARATALSPGTPPRS